jgi:hypothetical protein
MLRLHLKPTKGINMRRSTTKRSPNRASKHNDEIIIRESVTYAQAIAAFHSGFQADPDGDFENAAGLGARYERIARAALARLASIPTSSAEALQAKARIVPMILHDDGHGHIREDSGAFYQAFAADVCGFLEPIINKNAEQRKRAAQSLGKAA